MPSTSPSTELDQLIEFYETPIGRKLVREQPQMTTESHGDLGQSLGSGGRFARKSCSELAPEFDKRGLKMPQHLTMTGCYDDVARRQPGRSDDVPLTNRLAA